MFFKLLESCVIFSLIVVLTKTARISEEKCQEYAKFVHDVEVSPVLRMGNRKNNISHCGIIETPLIIGGTRAKQKEFPHMVAIGYQRKVYGKNKPKTEIAWDCGGSIISDYFVLTASHCLQSTNGPAVIVRAGTINLKEPAYDYQDRKIIELIKHPKYKRPPRYHDIGLLKLEKPFEFNGYVRPACLETQDELLDKSFIASGFGKNNWEDEYSSDTLMKVTLDKIPKEDCELTYKVDLGGKQFPDGIIPSMLCAGVMTGGKDTCQGDSGGPLQRVLLQPYCMYSIVGVTSFGKFCGFANLPAIYMRVSMYVDWIESVVWPQN